MWKIYVVVKPERALLTGWALVDAIMEADVKTDIGVWHESMM